MKHIFLAWLFTISQLAYGANAKDIRSANQMPGVHFRENHSNNPGFEQNNENSLTDSNNIASISSTSPLSGTNSLLVDAGTSGHLVKVLGRTMKLIGGQCEATFYYNGDASLYKAYVLQGSTKVSSEVTLQNVGTSGQLASMPFPCGDGTAPDVTIEATSASAAAIRVDDVYTGMPVNIGTVAQATFFGGMEQAGASTCSYSENTSTGTTDFKDLGSGSSCSAWTVTGGVTATGTNDHRPVLSNLAPGTYKVEVAGTFLNNTSAQQCVFRLSDGTTTYQPQSLAAPSAANGLATPSLHFSVTYTTAQSSVTLKIQAGDDGAGSCSLYNAAGNAVSWKVYYFPSQAQTVASVSATNWRVDANISGANPSLGTASVSSYTGIENSSLTLTNNTGNNVLTAQIPCSSTNSPSGTTCSAGSESVGVSFTLPAPTDVLACASFSWAGATGAGGALDAAFQVVETPSNAQTISQEGKSRVQAYVGNASTSNNYPLRVCGTFTFSSSGQKTLRLMYEQSVTGTVTTSLALADANASVGQRDIHWEVYPLNTLFGAPLIVGSVTSNSSGMERVERAKVTCSSSSSIISQSGTWISSIGNLSSGACVLTLASGLFSATPTCTATVNGTLSTNHLSMYVNETSATSVTVGCTASSTGSSTIAACTGSNNFNVRCQGAR